MLASGMVILDSQRWRNYLACIAICRRSLGGVELRGGVDILDDRGGVPARVEPIDLGECSAGGLRDSPVVGVRKLVVDAPAIGGGTRGNFAGVVPSEMFRRESNSLARGASTWLG